MLFVLNVFFRFQIVLADLSLCLVVLLSGFSCCGSCPPTT